MNKKIQAVIAVLLAVWLFVMGFEFGKYHEKKTAAHETPTADVLTDGTALPAASDAAPTGKTSAPAADVSADEKRAPTESTAAPTSATFPSLTDATFPSGLEDLTTYPIEDALTTYPEEETAAAPTASDPAEETEATISVPTRASKTP